MVKIAVIGGGMCGLLAGMVLAGDGHEVTVLERDPAPPTEPRAAWGDWDRSSVRQFHMGHFFLPPFRAALGANLPHVVEALAAGGALRVNPVESIPEELTGGWQRGDERFEALTGSRPMVESVVARCAAETTGLTVERGAVVKRLLVAEGTQPVHVIGVETADGRSHSADLVVDASGRNSGLPRLLAAVGAPAPVEEADDSGFVYYGRALRSPEGQIPVSIGGGLQHYGSISTLTLGADNGTWALAFVASGKDKVMRRVRDERRFTELWQSYPLVAHWLDGEPLSGVEVMGNLEDRIRHFVVDGEPVATGLVAVGDSWACTNPSVGRGASMGLLQVIGLRDVIRQQPPDDARAFTEAFWAWTAANIEVLYRETVRGDRHRLAQIEAAIDGSAYTPADPVLPTLDALPAAAMKDPALLRVYFDAFMMNRPVAELLADDGVVDRIEKLGADAEQAPGLDRAQLEAVLA